MPRRRVRIVVDDRQVPPMQHDDPGPDGAFGRAATMLQEIGSADALPVVPEVPLRPLWRGRLHQLGVVICVPPLVILAASTTSTRALVAVLIYAVGLTATFAVSAVYHRLPNVSPRWRSRLQRADHATIYLAIGGTCTPVCLVGLPAAWGIPTLSVVGAGVAGGIVCALIRRRWAEITSGVLYIAVGWSVVVAFPALVIHSGCGAGAADRDRRRAVHGRRVPVLPRHPAAVAPGLRLSRGLAHLHPARRRLPLRRRLPPGALTATQVIHSQVGTARPGFPMGRARGLGRHPVL